MTKGAAIDQIVLAVAGGFPNLDINVLRADVESYLPVAIDYYMVAERRAGRQEDRAGIGFSTWADTTYVPEYTLTPLKDTSNGKWYVELPGKVMSLIAGSAIQSCSLACAPTSQIYVAKSVREFAGADDLTDGMSAGYMTLTSSGKSRIYFVSPISDEVVVSAILDVGSLENDAEIAAPAGIMVMAIDKAVAFFRSQRQTPADITPEGSDINERK